MNTERSVKQMLEAEAAAIMSIPETNDYEGVVDLIIDRIHQQGGRLITSGMGKAGQIALNIATTFSSTGTPSYFLHPSEAQHGDLGIIRENDLVLLVSNSGKTREVLELIALIRHLVPTMKFVLISGNAQCELALLVDKCLSTGNPKELCPLGLTPTTSTTTMTVIGDILVVMTMNRIQFTYEDYAKRHHGGYLGLSARKQIND